MSGELLGAGVTMIHIDEDTKELFTLLRESLESEKSTGSREEPQEDILTTSGLAA